MDNLTPTKFSTKELFNLKNDSEIEGFKETSEYVPDIDHNYSFDPDTTNAIIAGFKYNKRVIIQGLHGSGKSSHIEQIAARLNWPCMRVNLDGHISRIDMIGRDSIVLKDGKQVTEFKDGIIPWSVKNPIALILDEYDAARADVMFVIQRLLEADGKFTVLDKNQVIKAHPYFRIFATTNTIGLGDSTGLYHGTQLINQSQMDRWNIVSVLNYLSEDKELQIITKKTKIKKDLAQKMIQLANLTRQGFKIGDISTVMSPRTIISWAENYSIFNNLEHSFSLSFLNKCDETEKPIIAEYYQRIFDMELEESIA